MTTRDPLDYGWWLASRSAGIVAYLLLSLAVVIGLAMALRVGGGRMRVELRAVHERMALLALGATAAHGLLLLGDPWLKPRVVGVLVPFSMDYRPVWTGLGVAAGYLAAGLSLTFYLRRRIGFRRWRLAHRFIPIAWGLAAIHVVGAGTDGLSLWLDIPVAVTVALVIALLAERLLAGRTPAAAPPKSARLPAGDHDATPAPDHDATPAPLWSHL
jgi:methionine sulfoxide reductase heme-binding subunit